jgi:nitrogen fixation-related uncharacterized protein
MKGGQFDDNHTPAIRILFENKPNTKNKEVPSTKSK